MRIKYSYINDDGEKVLIAETYFTKPYCPKCNHSYGVVLKSYYFKPNPKYTILLDTHGYQYTQEIEETCHICSHDIEYEEVEDLTNASSIYQTTSLYLLPEEINDILYGKKEYQLFENETPIPITFFKQMLSQTVRFVFATDRWKDLIVQMLELNAKPKEK